MLTQDLPKTKVPKPFYRSKWLWIPLSVVVVLLVLAYVAIGIYGASTFNTYAKRATPFSDATPATYNLSYEEISFKTTDKDGITLRGWWIPNPNATRALVVVHGRDSDRTRLLTLARPLWDQNYSLLFFDMRGMGKSDTDRYFFGMKEKNDVVGAFNYVKSRGFDPAHIGIVAHSMGAASSLLAMSVDPEIKVVASYSAYADFPRVAEYRITIDNGLPSWCMPGVFAAASIMYGLDANQTKPEKVLPDLKDRKIFLMHGDKDTDVPIDHFNSLVKAGGSNIVETWIIPGAGHADAIDLDKYRTEYVNRMVAFFDKELAR